MSMLATLRRDQVMVMVEYSLPSVANLRSYLRLQGWEEQPSGPVGALWIKSGRRVGVPDEFDADLVLGVVERVASAEGRTSKDVANAATYLLYDVTHLRAANDYRIVDTIPLETAGRIINSARTMFRATATTARWERSQIGGNYSTLGDEVVRQALMGHTEKGSFVIPVLVPLPEPAVPEEQELPLDHDMAESVRFPPEPFERRVVRTFAQSMQALQEIVVEPAHDPTADQIHELVYRGVSREFCAALAGILDESAVAEFEARVDWAPAIPAPATMPQSTAISADAVDLVSAVANKLRQQRVDPQQVFSGTIVQLRHESQDDPFGEIAISTVRRGRASEILVRLPMEDYRRAWDWHSAGRAVLVEGNVRRAPGKPLRVDSPIRCHPVDEMFLPIEQEQTGTQSV
jgi:hypothetical protein